jgi:methyltransferase family protein
MNKELFNPIEHPVCLEFPLWLEETAWAEHIPFAMFLTSAMRPRLFVELGAYRGVSYCAFCQTVKALNLGTKCYAVDTWRGDAHAGEVDDAVLSKLRTHHDPLYAQFSRLVQSTFDEASTHFDDSSIDLLHLDGFHTYEAVKYDFETWLNKMSKNGIVLLHDTNVRERDFGVCRFWAEVCEAYPNFAFLHGHGLGVLSVGEHMPEDLRFLFSADELQTAHVRQFFHTLGARIEAINHFHRQNEYISLLKTHEKTVLDSKLMRAYRVLQFEGLRSFWKKAKKSI